MEKYTRDCPKCGNEITHKTKRGRNQLLKSGAICRNCANINEKAYTKEEEDILIEYYFKFGSQYCKELLPNRSLPSIKVKARKLGLKYRQIDNLDDPHRLKRCSTCRDMKTLHNFNKDSRRVDKLSPTCKECLEKCRIRDKKKKYEYDVIYRKNRAQDLEYILSKRLRTRIYHALRAKNIEKTLTTAQLVGCSISELKSYLSSLFTAGMNWENKGNNGWHIDHIIPCAAFDLTDPDQQRKCFHYTNLQPLWATTKIAMKYGHGEDYVGNLNKWCKDIS